MRRYLLIAGWIIWVPAAAGVFGRYVVEGYRGEASWMLWTGIGCMAAAWAWGWAERRFKKPMPEPVKSTIYDWIEDDDSVEFFARREDGSEHAFTVRKGATVTRSEGAAS